MAGDSFISATAQESSSCFGDQPCSLYVLDHPRPPETSTNGLFAAAASSERRMLLCQGRVAEVSQL